MTGDWRDRAACKDADDPELWFPIGTTGPAREQEMEAKAACKTCPAVEDCLKWALATGQEFGVWGGLNEDERRSLKRRMRDAAKKTQQANKTVTHTATGRPVDHGKLHSYKKHGCRCAPCTKAMSDDNAERHKQRQKEAGTIADRNLRTWLDTTDSEWCATTLAAAISCPVDTARAAIKRAVRAGAVTHVEDRRIPHRNGRGSALISFFRATPETATPPVNGRAVIDITEVEFLLEGGASLADVARSLNVRRESVMARLTRAGRHDLLQVAS